MIKIQFNSNDSNTIQENSSPNGTGEHNNIPIHEKALKGWRIPMN